MDSPCRNAAGTRSKCAFVADRVSLEEPGRRSSRVRDVTFSHTVTRCPTRDLSGSRRAARHQHTPSDCLNRFTPTVNPPAFTFLTPTRSSRRRAPGEAGLQAARRPGTTMRLGGQRVKVKSLSGSGGSPRNIGPIVCSTLRGGLVGASGYDHFPVTRAAYLTHISNSWGRGPQPHLLGSQPCARKHDPRRSVRIPNHAPERRLT
jgi:hypothetical protein